MRYTKKGAYCASISKEWYKEAQHYAVQKDIKALDKLLASKRIFPLKAGVAAYVEDQSMWGGWKKIRPVGETTTFYTHYDAVE